MSEKARQNILEPLDPSIADIAADETRPRKGYIFCAACSHVIAHTQDRIEVQGALEHTCTNPYGYVHRFGCYREAPGCAVIGGTHSADSWFSGYRWRLAHCGGCDAHLGWAFEKPDQGFFGLILNRVQQD